MDRPTPDQFGRPAYPLTPHAPDNPLDRIDAEQLEEIAPGVRVPPLAFEGRYRRDGWTPERRARFCELIAEGHTVDTACYMVGLSASSAYQLRRRAAGKAFGVAWDAASLLARSRVSDRLMARALDGQTERVVRPDGTVIERHRFDNRLALGLLARLDRQVEAERAPADLAAARLVAGDFDAFLDLIRRDAAPARAGLFLLQHQASDDATAATLAPVAALARADAYVRGQGVDAALIAALDPEQRHAWTAEQWAAAELAGLVAIAPAPPADDMLAGREVRELPDDRDRPGPVWIDTYVGEWRTSFPYGPGDEDEHEEECDPWQPEGWSRALTPDEEALVTAREDDALAPVRAEALRARAAYFAALAGGMDPDGGGDGSGGTAPACSAAREEIVGAGGGDGAIAVALPGDGLDIGDARAEPGDAALRARVVLAAAAHIVDGDVDGLDPGVLAELGDERGIGGHFQEPADGAAMEEAGPAEHLRPERHDEDGGALPVRLRRQAKHGGIGRQPHRAASVNMKVAATSAIGSSGSPSCARPRANEMARVVL